MERAFIVTKESQYYIDAEDYLAKVKQQGEFVRKFLKEKGIESTQFYLSGNGFVNVPFGNYEKDNITLSIIPTENDTIKYDKQLTKPDEYELRRFKKVTKILKEFAQYCVDNKVVINLHEPDLRDYLKSMDWCSYSRQLIPHEQGYCLKIASDLLKENDNPKGFIEIKLSEFYKALEEYEKNRC